MCSGDCPGIGPNLPASLTVIANIGAFTPQAAQIIGQVVALTGPITKQVDCVAAAELPIASTLGPSLDDRPCAVKSFV